VITRIPRWQGATPGAPSTERPASRIDAKIGPRITRLRQDYGEAGANGRESETHEVKILSGQQFAQMGREVFVNDFALLGEKTFDALFGMPIDDTVLAYTQAMQPGQFISECSGIANRKSKDGGFEFAPGFLCKAALILAHLICD